MTEAPDNLPPRFSAAQGPAHSTQTAPIRRPDRRRRPVWRITDTDGEVALEVPTRPQGWVCNINYCSWATVTDVSEQQDVVEDLDEAGVLDAIRWAYRATVSRTLELFSEPDGHDPALLGNIRFTYFRDRLDRVFSTGRYEVRADGSPTDHLDLVYAELTQVEIDTMPQITPGTVVRDDLNGSPGWRFAGRRFLLAACVYGQIAQLPWPRKSPTKQRVAKQRPIDPTQDSLFSALAEEELAGLEELMAATFRLDVETFVVAHSLDVVTEDADLVLGRPRHNSDGGKAWHWSQNLLVAPPGGGGLRTDVTPKPTGADAEPDAPVRLRPSAQQSKDGGV